MRDVLACPRCASALRAGGARPADRACDACGTAYPAVGAVSCLVPEPALWRALWTQHLDEYLVVSAARIAEINAERGADGILPRTRERLIAMMGAIRAEREAIERILAPLRPEAPEASGLIPAPAAASRDLAVLHGFETLFRDWAWGEDESATALRTVQRLATDANADATAGTVAVFGAGAGRLAADLHRALGPARTVALDLNPLPLLVADQLVRGGTVELHEFPVGPRTAAEVAVARVLRCPVHVGEGLSFVLADALRPPLARAAVDVLVTPWFIDAAGVDVPVIAEVVNRVLRPGGVWLNLGPLRFTGPPARLHPIEEVLEIVAGSGFSLGAELREQVPYFASPASGAHRLEVVYGFAARKTGEAPAAPRSAADPPWLADPRLPIPALPQWAALQRSAVFTAGVLSLIDGQRSVAGLAEALGRSWGVDPRSLEPQLRAFLSRLARP